ncbi:MAG: acyl-CoA thioesterase [Phycisphaerales bacterium]|nr:acyl-CoA thioesterase [Phycisphaerales bacterium]
MSAESNGEEDLRPARRPEVAGAIRVRVRYCECDPMGVAHHAAYVPWLEMGRTELLRSSGVSYAQLEASGVFLVIVKLGMSYRRPVLYDDVVEVRTRVAKAGRVKIEHEYEVVLVEREVGSLTGRLAGMAASAGIGEVLASGMTVLASVDAGGNVCGLPEWLVGS